jgi:hypothetical protein
MMKIGCVGSTNELEKVASRREANTAGSRSLFTACSGHAANFG